MKKIIAAGILALTLGGGFLGGLLVGNATEPMQGEDVDAFGNYSILPTSELTWLMHFSLCDHDVVSHDGTAIMGMSEKQIIAAFPGSSVLTLDGKSAVIMSELDGYCPAHFVLRSEEDGLMVERFSLAAMRVEDCVGIDIPVSEFAAEVVEALKIGIPFDSLEEVDMYIEAMET